MERDEVEQLQPITKKEQADSQITGDSPPPTVEKEEKEEEEKEEKQTAGFYPGGNFALGNLQNTLQGLSAPGLGAFDFLTDAVGTLVPGGAHIDNAWDRATKLPNELHQGIRKFASIVIPSMVGGSIVQSKGIARLPAEMPKLQKALVAAGLFSTQEAPVIGLSDVGEEHNMMRALSDFMPGVFGPKGSTPLPDFLLIRDDDSPAVRKRKNTYEKLTFPNYFKYFLRF